MITPATEHLFLQSLDNLATEIHSAAQRKGWWDEPRSDSEQIAHIHGEVSECHEGLRNGNPPSDHIPHFTYAEEEIADVIIRLLDWSKHNGWRIGPAILAKMRFNESRPYRHGKKF